MPRHVLLLTVVPLLAANTVSLGWAGPVTPSPNWASTLQVPDDPFAVVDFTNTGQPGWVKFTILTCDPGTVYFQNSVLYPFHYDFATTELDPFIGLSHEQFETITLHAESQEALLGAIVIPPLVGFQHAIPEYGIQLVGQSEYDVQTVIERFNAVKGAVIADPGVQAFYFPTFEQQAVAEANLEVLAAAGIPVSSTARWSAGNNCYTTGWAIGTLKQVAAMDVDAAYLSGELAPDDIVLLDGVPAELPYVAGIISTASSTPNSHVAILAGSYGVPFVHLAKDTDVAHAQELVGRRVVLRTAVEPFGACSTRLADAAHLTPAVVEELLEAHEPCPLIISAIAPYGAISAAVDDLVPEDIEYFGGKAANFGFLRRTIPMSSPKAAALSFDLWDAFQDQTLESGQTLRSFIDEQLGAFTYPPDMAAVAAALDTVRDTIKSDTLTVIDAASQAAVIAALQEPAYEFNPDFKIRFRSSTNVEDSDQFVGAGLYDSKSGCLADDLDGDADGPSHCDATDANERGVFRAIRRVFASFYNDNAFLERLRRGVNESDVGMAVLVHHSFPDEIELANGVAIYRQGPGSSRSASIVTQVGATSVTNPEGGALPEEMDIYVSLGGTIYATLLRLSSLVPLGATVLTDPDDYVELTQWMIALAEAYEDHTAVDAIVLEFEFKMVAPGGGALPGGGLVIKQIRRVPQPDSTPTLVPFLLNAPRDLRVFQGEYGDVFANHRLKSRWHLETGDLWATPENLQSELFTDARLDYVEGCARLVESGPLADWPEHTHSVVEVETHDTWRLPQLQNPREYRLTVGPIPELVTPAAGPVIMLEDLGFDYDFSGRACHFLQVDYDTPQPSWDWTGPVTTLTDHVVLCARRQPQIGEVLKTRVLEDPGVMTVTTSFYWPPDPGATAGYTAPLVRWEQTVIEGLTTMPLVLTGEFAQTYRPEHHNFSEHFIFEPALEPSVTAQQRAELDAAGIRIIHVLADVGNGQPNTFAYYDSAAWGDVCLSCRPFGDVTADAVVDLDDVLCVLDAFSGQPCPLADIMPCAGDALVDLQDIVAVLDAFQGTAACSEVCECQSEAHSHS